MSKLVFISSDLLWSSLFGINYLFWLIAVLHVISISDEGSLPEIALSGESKLASTYFSLCVHVFYTEIGDEP